MCLTISYGYSVNIASSTLAQPAFQAYFRLDSSPRATAIVSAVGVAPFVGAAIITPFIPWGAGMIRFALSNYLTDYRQIWTQVQLLCLLYPPDHRRRFAGWFGERSHVHFYTRAHWDRLWSALHLCAHVPE
jgi:hypothetical protein